MRLCPHYCEYPSMFKWANLDSGSQSVVICRMTCGARKQEKITSATLLDWIWHQLAVHIVAVFHAWTEAPFSHVWDMYLRFVCAAFKATATVLLTYINSELLAKKWKVLQSWQHWILFGITENVFIYLLAHFCSLHWTSACMTVW